MLLFVLIVASLNLALGVGVAIVASHDWTDYLAAIRRIRWRWPRRSAQVAEVAEPEAVHSPSEPAAEAGPANPPPRLELPAGWHERLAEHEVVPTSVLEAVLHLVRAEGETHRARWTAAEQSLRTTVEISNELAAQSALTPLQAEMSAWLDWVRPFQTDLKSLRPRLGEHEACADKLEELLLDQVARVEALQKQLEALPESSDKEVAIRKFLRDCAKVFELSHAVRDFAVEQMATAVYPAGRVAELPDAWQRDPISGCPNRLGLEALLAHWQQQDPSRQRLVSGAFIEIDRLGKLNERVGVQQSDLVVRAFAKLVEGVIRSDRGDRVARIAGPTIFVLLTDATVAGAKAAAERIRQTVEAATFQSRREEFTLAANCAVCEFLPADSTVDLLARLRAGIAEAKRGGRNRTAADEGQGPVLFDPDPVQVRAQAIKV